MYHLTGEMVALVMLIILTHHTIYVNGNNLAEGRPTSASSGTGIKARVVDGNKNAHWREKSCWEADVGDMNPYWMVDLEHEYYLHGVSVTNRGDCCDDRLHDIEIEAYVEDPTKVQGAKRTLCRFYQGPVAAGATKTLTCSQPIVKGRYVKINGLNRLTSNDRLTLCEAEVYASVSPCSNQAKGRPTSASSGTGLKARVVDGNSNPHWRAYSCWEANVGDMNPYWMVDLQNTYFIHSVSVTNRGDCCGTRLHDIEIEVYTENPTQVSGAQRSLCSFYKGPVAAGATKAFSCFYPVVRGRYVKINGLNRIHSIDRFTLCEVEVYACLSPCSNLAMGRPTSASSGTGLKARVVDGNSNPHWRAYSCWEANVGDMNPYWMVDLQNTHYIHSVSVTNRGDCCGTRLHDIEIEVYTEDPVLVAGTQRSLCNFYKGPVAAGITHTITCSGPDVRGRYVKINGLDRLNSQDRFTLCEVEVVPCFRPCVNLSYVRHESRRLSGTTTVQTSITRAACSNACVHLPNCVGFNYNAEGSVCEMVTVERTLAIALGWDFYSITYGL